MSTDKDLAPLAGVPAPHRTDEAFTRAVREGVRKRRARTTFALPTLAAATAAFAFLVVRSGPDEPVAAGAPVAPIAIAIADPFDDDDALFALPLLDGSSDEELAQLDRVLDRRLSQRGVR